MEENKNRRFRNHISIVAEQVGGGIVAIGAVLLVNLLQEADELSGEDLSAVTDRGSLIMAVILAFLAAGIVNRIFVWAKTYISIEENAVVIERGTMNKKKNTIGIRNISNINLEQNLFEMLLGTCKVKMDTNSRSTADSTDVKIVLKKADAERFKQEITRRMQAAEQAAAVQSGMAAENEQKENAASVCGAAREAGPYAAQEEEAYDFHAEFGDVFQHGLFSINIFSMIILLLGIAGAVVTAVRILGQPDLMTSVLSAAAGAVAAGAVFLSALWDTVKDFIRYYDFRAKRRGERIFIRYGFLKKVEYTIPVDKIQALKVRQSLVARLFGRYMAEIVNVGMGDDKDERNSFLVLYSTKEQLRERLALRLPEFAENTTNIATWQYVLNKASVHKEAALRFLEYAASREGSIAYSEYMNRLPARVDIIREEDLDIPGFDQLRDYVENTQLKERPFSRNTMEDITSMGTLFQRYVLEEITQEEFCQKAQNITDNF